MDNMDKKKLLSIICIVLAAIAIGLFSYYNEWLGDDVAYAYNCGDKSHHISSFYEIIQSQNVHYFTSNGRYLAHVLVQGFCGLWGLGAFSVCNAIIYLFFFFAIFRLSGISLDNFKGVASVVLLSLLSFQTKMQPSCQIGFVWMFTFTLWLLIKFFRSDGDKSVLLCILFGLLSIIVGNGQEVLNFGVCVAFFLYWLKNMRKMSAMQYSIMIGFCIGSMTNFLAPGTLNRGSGMAGVSFNRIFFSFLIFAYTLRSVWVLCAVMIYRKLRHRARFKEIYSANSFYFNSLFALLIFSAICHFQSNRVGFGVELLSIIVVIRILPQKAMNYFWISVAVVMLAIDYFFQVDYTIKTKRIMGELQQKYSASSDGKIYADINIDSPLTTSRNFSRPLVPYGVNNGGDFTYYEYNCLAKRLAERSPGKPKVRIIPSVLKDKEHENLGNQLIYAGNNIWIAVQSKSAPAEFVVNRKVPLLPAVKQYEPVKVDMADAECIVAEGDNWRARYIAEIDYSIHGLNFTSSLDMTDN